MFDKLVPRVVSPDHKAYLDGWRGIAILSVLVGHYIYGQPINMGRFGVELFFVLSGRLMGQLLFEKRAPLPQFFFRRFSRIYPALIVFVVLAFIGSQWFGDLAISWVEALSAATFTYNYVSLVIPRSPFLDHIWSLCIEEHIYIILACIAALHRRFNFPAVPIILALALLAMLNGIYLTTVHSGDYYEVYWRTDVRGASILLGAAVYLIVRRQGLILDHRLVPAVFLACVILAGLLNMNAVPDTIKYTIGSGLLACAIALVDRASKFVLDILSSPALTLFGMVSYSLYLWQQPFFQMAPPYWRLLLLPLAFLAAFASFRLIEAPFRSYLNTFYARWQGRAGSRTADALGR